MSKKEVTIDEFRIEDIPLSCTWIIVGPPGSGKCLAPGTPIIMFDGSTRKVEDVKVNDVLMGDDSGPRIVLSTTTGRDKMYRISQSNGDDYVVNEPHILVLRRTYMPKVDTNDDLDTVCVRWLFDNAEHIKLFDNVDLAEKFLDNLTEGVDFTHENYLEVSVKDYLQLDPAYRELYKGFQAEADFDFDIECSLPYDPRSIGMWLGARESHVSITDRTEDDVFLETASRITEDSGLFDYFKWTRNLESTKRIPEEYKLASKENRMKLIAGFVDAAGSLIGDCRYELQLQNKQLVADLTFIARSVGLHVKICYDTIIEIQGRGIPVFLTRNKCDGFVGRVTSDITVTEVGEGTYHGFQIDGNKRFLLGDFTVTHNTTFMENMCYYHKHRYPVGRIFIGTEGGYKHFSGIFHPLFVSNYYDETEEKSHILRQRKCALDNGEKYTGNYAINILDDVSDDPKIYKSRTMNGLFKLGSQHWHQLLMIGSQYAIDMPPAIRKATSYVALFREPEEGERKKLYANFGGLAGSYQNFCDLMDQLTGDYTCIVFKKRSQSNLIEECVYWYQTKKLDPWKFGCNEYRAWGKDRYNTNHVEQLTI